MKYSLRSLMILTAGGVAAGWGLAALICGILASREISFPANSAKGVVTLLFAVGMLGGGIAGAWVTTKLTKASP